MRKASPYHVKREKLLKNYWRSFDLRTTRYTVESKKFGREIKFALVADLHGREPSKVIEILKRESPDYILMPGDIFENLDGSCDSRNGTATPVLAEAAKIAPVFYSTGNHEDGQCGAWWKRWKKKREQVRRYSPENMKLISDSGVTYLEDNYVIRDGIAFGGLSSGLINAGNEPNIKWISEFSALDCPKVLLCHHPEYYEKYLHDESLDLIVSGHAHGGQWQIFGRGVFAPGQGLFPKYTHGVHDGRLVISRGLQSNFPVPRFFNPREVVIINVK